MRDMLVGLRYLEFATKPNSAKTLVLNPGTAHKKVASVSGAFKESGIIILDIRTKEYKFIGSNLKI